MLPDIHWWQQKILQSLLMHKVCKVVVIFFIDAYIEFGFGLWVDDTISTLSSPNLNEYEDRGSKNIHLTRGIITLPALFYFSLYLSLLRSQKISTKAYMIRSRKFSLISMSFFLPEKEGDLERRLVRIVLTWSTLFYLVIFTRL